MRASGCPRCILCVPQQVIAAARTASGSAVAVAGARFHSFSYASYDTYRAVARR